MRTLNLFLFISFATALAAQDTTGGAFPVSASIDTFNLQSVVVTAARRPQLSQWVCDDHNLVAVSKLQLGTAKNLIELIQTGLPDRVSDYGSGASKTLSLRGAGSERTLVLVDGKRMGTDEGDLGDISPESIEKVEIVEGGQSSLYGMDAVGGVVNIVTKSPASGRPRGNISLALSSFEPKSNAASLNGKGLSLSTGRRLGRFEWLGGLDYRTSDGNYEYPDSNDAYQSRDHNGYADWGTFQKLNYTFDAVRLGASARYSERDTEIPGMITWPSPANSSKKIGFVAVDGSWSAKEFLTLRLNSSFSGNRIRYTDSNPAMPQDSRHAKEREDAEFVAEFTARGQMVNAGLQGSRDELESNEIGDHTARQAAVFANCILRQTLSDFVFSQTPAVRFDYSTIHGGSLNAKTGFIAAWKGPLYPSLFVNAGTSERSPSFNDLYWPRDAYTVGNPDLTPEKGVSLDAGIQLRQSFASAAGRGRFTVYSMRLDDMILWQPDTNWVWSPANVAQAQIRGYKADLVLTWSGIGDFGLNLAMNDARDGNTDKVLIYRPKYIANMSGRRFGNRTSQGVSVRYSGQTYINAENSDSLPSTVTIDVNAGCKVLSTGIDRQGLWLVYDMINITNQAYSAMDGYPLPGREHRLSVKMDF